MLKMQAVFPRVRALEVLIEPIHSLTEIGRWPKRGACRSENASLKGVRERVVRVNEVV